MAFLIGLFPPSQRPMVRAVSARIGDRVGRWVLGQVAVAVISGVLAGIAAVLLGLPYPVLIAVATALLAMAPAVGPGATAVPVFFLGLAHSPLFGIIASVVFLAPAQFDGHVVWPLVTGKAVELSTSLIIMAAALGLAFYGAVGVLIAVPVAVAIKVICQEVFLPWLWEKQRAAGGG